MNQSTLPASSRRTTTRGLLIGTIVLATSAGLSNAEPMPTKADVKATETTAEKKGPATKPASVKPAPTAKKVDPLVAVVKKLSDEYRSALKDPAGNKVRTTSNYGTENPDPAITSELVFKTLERQQSSDARVEAYVKWQLLSYLGGLPDDKDVPKLLSAYSRAPLPPAHPGMDRQALQRALSRPGMAKAENENAVNSEFDKVMDQYDLQAGPMLSYRDALFGRLPIRGDCAAAGWEDVRERVRLGLNCTAFAESVAGATRSWSLAGATPAQINAMIGLVESIRKDNENKDAQAFNRVEFDERNAKLDWRARPSVNGALFKDLITSLREAQSNPDGGIKLRSN